MGDISIKGKSPILKEMKALLKGTKIMKPLPKEDKKKFYKSFAAPWDKDSTVVPKKKR